MAETPSWTPPGPVAEAFVACDDPVAVLMGPVRSGKTTAGLIRGLFLAYRWPEVRPGLRRFRLGVLRRQMVDLERTTIPSWTQWFPRTRGVWRGARGEPQTHELRIPHPKGGVIEYTVEFRGIGELRLDEALRGWEPSAAFIDECDTMPEDTFGYVLTRVGSYPRETLAEAPRRVWGTCNAPPVGNWVLRDLIQEPKPGWVLYRQPSGLSPQAENLAALGPDWYRGIAASMPEHLRRRFIENQPGVAVGTVLVYPEFNLDLHVAKSRLEVLPNVPVLVGLDAGGTPAASLWQIAANGQRRCIGELTTHAQRAQSITGPQRFGELLARLLAERCRGLAVQGVADPSAAYGGDKLGEGSWIEIVARAAGIDVRAASSNDPTLRQEALRAPLNALIDGRHPALLICPSCTETIAALGADYHYRVTAGQRRSEQPLKNWASHLVEAAQYAVMDADGAAEAAGRRGARERRLRPVTVQAEFNPL